MAHSRRMTVDIISSVQRAPAKRRAAHRTNWHLVRFTRVLCSANDVLQREARRRKCFSLCESWSHEEELRPSGCGFDADAGSMLCCRSRVDSRSVPPRALRDHHVIEVVLDPSLSVRPPPAALRIQAAMQQRGRDLNGTKPSCK
eukprot:4152770-Prymnesium_polylepis.4